MLQIADLVVLQYGTERPNSRAPFQQINCPIRPPTKMRNREPAPHPLLVKLTMLQIADLVAQYAFEWW
jgi:hypothetical protein